MSGRALVVGAGIGGLAVGRVLRLAGFDVRILERAPSLEPLGAGISLWPNATSVLSRLGLEGMVASHGAPPNGGIMRSDGRTIAPADPAAIESRYGAPMVVVHRATLLEALLGDGMEELVDTGVEIVRVEEDGDEVLAEARGGEVFRGDLLIGADGVDSTVRAALWGAEPPRHSGLLAYRAVVGWEGDLPAGEYWGRRSAFGVVPIDRGRIYWYATRPTDGGEPAEDDPIPALIERFSDWAPEVTALIRATPPSAVLRHDLRDRPPSRSWVRGRIGLLGDAAHPMLPFLGQGACQAIEDAGAVGEALATEPDAPSALELYEARRRKRANHAVRLSHRIGKLIHVRSTMLRSLRDRAMALTPEAIRMRQLDSVVGPG